MGLNKRFQPHWPTDLESARAVLEFIATQHQGDSVPAIGIPGVLMAACIVVKNLDDERHNPGV